MRRPSHRIPFHLLDLPHPIVTDPDRLRSALLVQLLHRQPHFLPLLRPAVRTVDQKQIHISLAARLPGIDPLHAVNAFLIALFHAASRGEDLRREEDVGALQGGFARRFADFSFVAVVLRSVDMPVPGLQRMEAGLYAHA